jgi:hypothetical protein
MRSIPSYLHFQRLRTTAIRHFLRRKKLSKKPGERLLLVGAYKRGSAGPGRRLPMSKKEE